MLLGTALLAGCGAARNELDRQAVSGTVTCDGKPIPAGAILFEPDTYQSGTATGATIRDGSFSIQSRQGPVPGSYRVRIYMSLGIQAPQSAGKINRSSRPMVEFLPEHYNSKSELHALVSGRAANRFRFVLSSARSADER